MPRSSYPTVALAWCLSGAVTPTGFRVKAGIAQTMKAGRLVVSVNADLSSPAYVSDWQTHSLSMGNKLAYRTLDFTATGLNPATRYYYRIEGQDAAGFDTVSRSVKTAPSGAAAFKFALGSCSHLDQPRGLNKSIIHYAIAGRNPDVFLHLDDLLYLNPDELLPNQQRDGLIHLYATAPDVDFLNRTVPMVYMPGDHDIGPNDSTLDTANAETIYRNTRLVYRETMPHYPFVQQQLGETNIDHVTMTQVFDYGKVRFLLLDACSQSRITTGTALGRGFGNGDYWDQMTWLAGALAQAETDGVEWVFLCSPRGWQDFNQTSYADAFTAERQALCDLIENANVRVCLLIGDTHACAFDDGTTGASYATDGFARFPKILASSLYNSAVGMDGTDIWNGSPMFYRRPLTGLGDGMFVELDFSSDNKVWTAAIKGIPIDPDTFAPTTLATVHSNDVTPAVSFNNAAPSGAASSVLTVNLDKTWFGPCSVNWAGNGQSGTVTFKPNRKRASFNINLTASAGTFPITLSSPSGCTIGGTNPATVTVT